MQKLKASGVRGIENHNERLKTSRTNPDIDYEKSHLNKDLLVKDERTYYMRIKERIEELNLSKAIRKDAVVACGFICTSDRAFFEGLSQTDKDKFFQASHDFLKERYGEKNVISSKVHYDETTPHLHCYIVPVTSDNRLSAKSIFIPKELRSLQDDYPRHMRENGFDLQRGNPDSERKHLDVEEFKIKTRREEQVRENAELEHEKTVYKRDYDETKQKKEELKAYIGRLNTEGKKVVAMEEAQEQRKARISHENKTLDSENNILRNENNTLKNENSILRNEFNRLTQELVNFTQETNSKKREINTLEHQSNVLQNDIKALISGFEQGKDLKAVLKETESFWDVLESGEISSRQEMTDIQQDIISIYEACFAKHGVDLLDSLLGSLQFQIQFQRYGRNCGWDEAEAQANLSKLIGPEAAEKLRYKERDSFGR